MRLYRDWQFFNRKPEGSERLMQAIYTGKLWEIGFGLDPARFWISKQSKIESGRFDFHFHLYLPFNNHQLPIKPTIGYRSKGEWKVFSKNF